MDVLWAIIRVVNDFAVVNIGGKQFQVFPGEELLVPKVNGQPGDSLELDKLLLLCADGKVAVGAPYLEGKKLQAKIVSQEKGEKVRILKYKAKSRYHRRAGFRAVLTRIQIQPFNPTKETAQKQPLRTKVGPARRKVSTKGKSK